jgi:serine/threonine protein phosphatase 1
VIGDIHGCAAELKTLLNKLPLTPESTVVFLGDYIDRGPDSRQVVETILTLRGYCTVVTLLGNHEEMFLNFLKDRRSAAAGLFIYNGGGSTLASYADERGRYDIPELHIQFFRSLLLSYRAPGFFFVHAGVPDVDLESFDENRHRRDLLWIRKPFLQSRYRWSRLIVHGHSPVKQVEQHERRINMDTGCVYNRVLSAIELPSRQIYNVSRQKEMRRVHLRDFAGNRIAHRYQGAVPIYIHRERETLEFETVDYSEFGMLIRDITRRPIDLLQVGEDVNGQVGSQSDSLVPFTAKVLRIQESPEGRCYALMIATLSPSHP